MATCKECFHYDVCKIIDFPSMFGLIGDACEHNKNKADYVPVVRCSQCKHYKKINYDDVKPNTCEITTRRQHPYDYCSYGERRDAE